MARWKDDAESVSEAGEKRSKILLMLSKWWGRKRMKNYGSRHLLGEDGLGESSSSSAGGGAFVDAVPVLLLNAVAVPTVGR